MAIKVPYSEINNAVYNVLDHRRTYKVYGIDDGDESYYVVDNDFIQEVAYEMRDYFLSNNAITNSILNDLKDALIDGSMHAMFVSDVGDFLIYTVQGSCLHQIHKAIKDYREDLTMQQKDLDHDRFQSL